MSGYCIKCGRELSIDMMYCPGCGVRLGSPGIVEEMQIGADQLVQKVKELIHEGNVRRITIKDQKGRTVLEVPLTVGVVGVVLAPLLAAVGAIAALAMNYTLIVKRKEPEGSESPKT